MHLLAQVQGSEGWAVGLVTVLVGLFVLVVKFLGSKNVRVDTATAGQILDLKDDKARLILEVAEKNKKVLEAEAGEEKAERERDEYKKESEECRTVRKHLEEENFLLTLRNAELESQLRKTD